MKIFIYIIFIISLLFIVLKRYDDRTEEQKIVHRLMRRVVVTLQKKYPLKLVAISEAEDKGNYKVIGLNFGINEILSKEEGRKILINSTEELLNEINSDLKLRPFLITYPFKPENVEMTIYALKQDNSSVDYPNITVFTAIWGKVMYKILDPEKKYGFLREEESYQDALNIVKSQDNKINSINH